jgi:4-methyl-5(b-hydroxyethyl)-thiazole monophosphate biosynthesis
MIYLFLTNGFEDIEVVVTRDILKRADFDVKMVGMGDEFVTSTLDLVIKADIQIENTETENLKAVILPGGMPGTENLDKNQKVHEIISECIEKEILIGAICAAPMILGKSGFLEGKKACCFPGFEKYLKGAEISGDKVCSDGKIITAKGPGAAFEFAFEIIKTLRSESAVKKIQSAIHYLD